MDERSFHERTMDEAFSPSFEFLKMLQITEHQLAFRQVSQNSSGYVLFGTAVQ